MSLAVHMLSVAWHVPVRFAKLAAVDLNAHAVVYYAFGTAMANC